MICIYHSRDLDGYCSAAIVKKWHDEINDYPDNVGKGKLTLIGWDYGKPIPELNDEHLIMVDISFPKEIMLGLYEKLGDNFIWIDHHISAIKDCNDYQTEKGVLSIRGLQKTDRAACELTWDYLFTTKEMPMAVHLLGVYDSWRNKDKEKWDKQVMPFQYGMRGICNSVDSFPMQYLDSDKGLNDIVHTGRTLLEYQKQQNTGLCRIAFEKTFKGLRAICINASGTGSQTFESIWDENKYDLMISFFYNGRHDFYTVSLYSTKHEIDCSVLAKEMGGGGHKGAAGFQTNDFKTIFN